MARRAVVAVAAATLVSVPSATANPTSADLTLSGSLTITWQGDQALGCAAAGLCGISGELILRAPGSEGYASSSGGLSRASIGVSGTIRVRDRAQSPPGDCVGLIGYSDMAPTPAVELIHGRTWRAVLQPPASSGRCAGPLAADLARLPLPVKVSGGAYPRFDMRGTRSFTAGPFSGTATSTMVLRSAGPGSGGSGGSFTGSFFPGPSTTISPRRVLSEYVELRYRVAFIPSALTATFAGGTEPICQIVDSCGSSGSLSLSVTGASTGITIGASRRVRKRVSARVALDDFRRGRLSFRFAPELSASGTVTETVSPSGGLTCSDSAAPSTLGVVLGPMGPGAPPRSLPISLRNVGEPGIDVLRTHCPGPAEADVIRANAPLASASPTTSDLLTGKTEVSLTNAGLFSGLGYTGSRGGAVELELTLEHVAAGTREQTQ